GAAVDDQVGAGDQAGVVGAQPGDRVAEVGRGAGGAHGDERRALAGPAARAAPRLVPLRAAEPAVRAGAEDAAGGQALLGELGDQLGVVRGGGGRGDAVDPDAVGGEVHRRGPDEVVDAALVERVGDHAGGAVPAVGGGDADDRALDAALRHGPAAVLGV